MKEKLNQIALPLMLNNVLTLIIGLCDQAMIGHVSLSGFASVGIVAGLINTITGILGATAISFNILGARAKGQKDQALLEGCYRYYMMQSFIIGLISLVIIGCLGSKFLSFFYQLQGTVLTEAINYAIIFSCSIGLNLMIFMGSSYLKIANQTKYVLIGNLTAMICNVIFDYLLIFGHFGMPKLGIMGNAIGSILALLINLFIYALIIKRLKTKSTQKVSIYHIKECIKLSLPLMGQEFLEGILMVILIGMLVARIGLIEIAAYQLMNTIIEIAFMPVYAYGQAALTVISGGVEYYQRIVRQSIKQSFILYSVITVCFLVGSHVIFSLIVEDESVVHLAGEYFPLVIGITVLNVPSTIYKYGLQSVGKEKQTFILTCFSYVISLGVILIGFVFKPQLFMIYIGLGIAYGYLLYRFKRLQIA